MEALTPKEFFEKVLPEKFNPAKAAGVDVIVQVNLTNSAQANWVVTIKDQKLTAKEGTNASPTLTLKMSERDFLDLVNGKIGAEKAFFTGKVQFKGNIALALKLREAGFL
jgi:putative sterol carrier protein